MNPNRDETMRLTLTMYGFKKHGHNHYDTRLNMFADMIADVCHAIRQEGEEPADIICKAMRNFQAEEAAERLEQEYVL